MAQTRTITRPLTTTTEDEASSQTLSVHESGNDVNYLDNTAIVNGQLRLLGRFKFTTENNGASQRYKIEYLDFTSTADQTFVAAQTTTPFTEDEADSKTLVGYSPQINMHTQYVNAGDTTAS